MMKEQIIICAVAGFIGGLVGGLLPKVAARVILILVGIGIVAFAILLATKVVTIE